MSLKVAHETTAQLPKRVEHTLQYSSNMAKAASKALTDGPTCMYNTVLRPKITFVSTNVRKASLL